MAAIVRRPKKLRKYQEASLTLIAVTENNDTKYLEGRFDGHLAVVREGEVGSWER